jgi:TonB family protein
MKPSRLFSRCPLAIAVALAGFSSAVAAAELSSSKLNNQNADAAKNVVAPVVKKKVSPVYPYELLISGQTGWAEATFVVDYRGRPLFANPKEASAPAFAKATVAMIEASEYVPGKINKHCVMASAQEKCEFSGEAALDPEARQVLATLRQNPESVASVADLDERPHPMKQDSPAYPRALCDDGLTGQAEIEFIIDREGRVLFPRIVSATHEDFGWAAATAVAQWRFQAPKKNGKPVEAKMRVPILFDAQKLASSD